MKQDQPTDQDAPDTELRTRRKIVKGLAGLPAMATLISGSALATPEAVGSSLQCIGKLDVDEGETCLSPNNVVDAEKTAYKVGTVDGKTKALRELEQRQVETCYNDDGGEVPCENTADVASNSFETVDEYCPIYVDQNGQTFSDPGSGLKQVTDSCLFSAAMAG
jgi:hypothetical protein